MIDQKELEEIQRLCNHVWMPPRTEPLHERVIPINKKVYTFEDVRSHQPGYTWKHRWCLICLAPHPMDAARLAQTA